MYYIIAFLITISFKEVRCHGLRNRDGVQELAQVPKVVKGLLFGGSFLVGPGSIVSRSLLKATRLPINSVGEQFVFLIPLKIVLWFPLGDAFSLFPYSVYHTS